MLRYNYTEYARGVRIYDIELKEEVIKSLNDVIKHNAINPDIIPDITEEYLRSIFVDNSITQDMVIEVHGYIEGRVRKISLREYIVQLIREFALEEDPEVDWDVDDWEEEFYDTVVQEI